MVQKTPDILKKIVARKQEEIAESTKRLPIEKMIELANSADTPRGFFNSLNKKVKERQSGIIAEIKKASPSKGVLRENFEPVEIAQSYEDGGASCLSILRDKARSLKCLISSSSRQDTISKIQSAPIALDS